MTAELTCLNNVNYVPVSKHVLLRLNNIINALTRGGVPWSLGGVPVMVVVILMDGDDVVTMVGDTEDP